MCPHRVLRHISAQPCPAFRTICESLYQRLRHHHCHHRCNDYRWNNAGRIVGVGRSGAGGSEDISGAGRIFTIRAGNNSPENVYIQAAYLNGKPYSRCWLDYRDIVAGGTQELVMGAGPNKNWGVGE